MGRKLAPRTIASPPKPLPQRGHEEETETTLCTVEETPKEKYEPTLGWCMNCSRHAAHSAVDNLCYNCHKEANGFEFNDETKRWVKVPERKKK